MGAPTLGVPNASGVTVNVDLGAAQEELMSMLPTVELSPPVHKQVVQGLEQFHKNRVAVQEPKPSAVQSFVAKMQEAALPTLMIQIFCHYYEQLVAGETGFIYQRDAQPVADLPTLAGLAEPHAEHGATLLDRVVVIKLNGGLGTSMGMQSPKSLLPVKDGLRFLDIIVKQILHLRQRYQARVPLLLMNSFNTEAETEAALAEHAEFAQPLATSFIQHKEPKIDKATLLPVAWAEDSAKEWCPPGHGDIYAALTTSGMLAQLLAQGYEYAFVSNADNLGATLDLKILGYMATAQLPFLMEVAERSAADRKGGHLAQRPDGQLLLREIAQCPAEELESFQDITRYRYFNTNNLWVHLPTLQQVLHERNGILGLPLIRNEKAVDPTQPASPRVYQLETAMGSAIASFTGAQALCVDRSRFAPVKKNNDLLVLWSDAYVLDAESHLVENPQRKRKGYHTIPLVLLDERYYGLIDDLRARFPHGAPSLIDCTELRVEGNVYFGRDVVIRGKVQIINRSDAPLWIAAGRELVDEVVTDA